MKNIFIKTILFLMIIISTLVSCKEEKQLKDESIVRMNWNTGTVKKVKVSESFTEINTEGNIIKEVKFNDKDYKVELVYKDENDFFLKINLLNNQNQNPIETYIKNARINELSYLTEDWHSGLDLIANQFEVNYKIESNKYEIPNWFDYRKMFIDSLLFYADQENYSFNEWKKVYDHISMNTEYEYHFISNLMNDLEPIFDIYSFKVNNEQEIKTRLSWCVDYPIILSADKKSDYEYLFKIIDMSEIEKIKQERLKAQDYKIVGNEYMSFTVTQTLPDKSYILIELTKDMQEIQKITIDLFEEDLITHDQLNRKTIINIE